MKIDAGQYVSLWAPTVGLLAFAQLHPYMVVSWAPSEQNTLLLFLKRERGISLKIVKKIRSCSRAPVKIFASILGPFGTVEPVEQYDSVLIIATGHGITAIMSYVKKLMQLHAHPSTRTKRVHFIWQVKVVGMIP
jgi:NAD(P)H-flavin reductase